MRRYNLEHKMLKAFIDYKLKQAKEIGRPVLSVVVAIAPVYGVRIDDKFYSVESMKQAVNDKLTQLGKAKAF